MSEVTPDVSRSRSSDVSVPLENDPFRTLHKMSTTAGLGSGDYVAISGTAVTALLLGIASSLVLFGLAPLLLLPLAGVVSAVLAWRQVTNSNGTQTGRALAGLGLVLSLGFGGFHISKQAIESTRNRADEKQIGALIGQMEAAVKAEKYTDLYDLCDAAFQQRVSQAALAEKWRLENSSPLVGKVTRLENKLLKFDIDPVTEQRVSSGMVLVSFDKITGQDRQGMVFRKVGNDWKLAGLPTMFPPERAPAAGQGAPGGGADGPGPPPVVGPPGPAGPPAPQ